MKRLLSRAHKQPHPLRIRNFPKDKIQMTTKNMKNVHYHDYKIQITQWDFYLTHIKMATTQNKKIINKNHSKPRTMLVRSRKS